MQQSIWFPIVRNGLRVAAGVLLSSGWTTAGEVANLAAADPELVSAAAGVAEVVAGAVCLAIAETWWAFARRMGWAT